MIVGVWFCHNCGNPAGTEHVRLWEAADEAVPVGCEEALRIVPQCPHSLTHLLNFTSLTPSFTVTQFHSLTHTDSLTPSLTFTYSHSLASSLPHSAMTHSLTYTHTHTHLLSLTHLPTHSLTLSLTLSHSLSLTHSLSITHSLTHSVTSV